MILTLQRDLCLGQAQHGALLMDGQFFSFSLENHDKAIPAGTYPIKLYYSVRNQMTVPLLEKVPGRTYIEIHPANVAHELQGCIALGLSRAGTTILHSRAALEGLMKVLRLELKHGTVSIDVRNPEPKEDEAA